MKFMVVNNIYSDLARRYLLSLMVVSLLLPVSVLAADAELANHTTGPDSNNQNSVDQQSDTTSNSEANATTDNQLNLNLNTGQVSINNTTTAGNVKTGDVGFQAKVTNASNSSIGASGELNVTPSASDTSITSSNELTGPDSYNSNDQSLSSTSNIHESNNASINNCVCVEANTGGVTAKNVTTLGNITTGDIKTFINLTNLANVTTVEPAKAVTDSPPTVTPTVTLPSPTSIPGAQEVVQMLQTITEPKDLGRGGGFFPAGGNLLPLMMSLTLVAAVALHSLWYKPRSS